MIDVISSIKPVINKAKLVTLNYSAINNLVRKINGKELVSKRIHLNYFQDWNLHNLIKLTFLFNTINFCFWAKRGERKWAIKVENEYFDGSKALFIALEKAVKDNPNLLNGNFLATISLKETKDILSGDPQIPLLKERYYCLKEAGKILKEKFNGSFINTLKESKYDALRLIQILVDNFPCFNDISTYQGETVAFYKRAQLNSKMVNDILISRGHRGLKNLEKLTAFADYKIPQILRHLKILKYRKELASKVDNYKLILPQSPEEIEIRAFTIWAVELIKRKLQEKYSFVTAAHIDSFLWSKTQEKREQMKPYHRTLTIAY